jgi:hypothetical protein
LRLLDLLRERELRFVAILISCRLEEEPCLAVVSHRANSGGRNTSASEMC